MEEKPKEISLDSGSLGVENSWWLRERWWEASSTLAIFLDFSRHWLLAATEDVIISGLTQHTSLSLFLPFLTQWTDILVSLLIMAVNLIIYKSSKRDAIALLPSVLLSLLTSHLCCFKVEFPALPLSPNQAHSLLMARLHRGSRWHCSSGGRGAVQAYCQRASPRALRGQEATQPIIQIFPLRAALLCVIFYIWL